MQLVPETSRHNIPDRMAKRKRDDLQEKLEHHSTVLSRALKVAKGFERQRMSKRSHDPKSPREKRARIEKEIEVLKVHIPAFPHSRPEILTYSLLGRNCEG